MKTVYTIVCLLLFLSGVVYICLLAVFAGLNFGDLSASQTRPKGYNFYAISTIALSVFVLGSIIYGIVYFARKTR
jgi:hypothetical protein